VTGFTVAIVLATGLWLAVYRLPLRTPRARQRFRLAVSSRTGLPSRYVFPVVGTLIYLAAGLLAATGLILVTPVGWRDPLRWHLSVPAVALTLLAGLGAAALTTFAMTTIYAIRPGVDIPGAVANVRWIQEILVLPRQVRWLVPMVSAAVEEFFFRGVALTGLSAAGAPPWWAIAISGAVFTTGQVVLTETRLQALVLGLSSIVLSVVGGLLVVVTGSVIPAILVHASFAGYYTNAGARRPTAEYARS
jgi:hypothetical protein